MEDVIEQLIQEPILDETDNDQKTFYLSYRHSSKNDSASVVHRPTGLLHERMLPVLLLGRAFQLMPPLAPSASPPPMPRSGVPPQAFCRRGAHPAVLLQQRIRMPPCTR